MRIENVEALRTWLVATLGPICDADPEILAKYILALLKKDKPLEDLKDVCERELDIFLQDKTKHFVVLLFDTLQSREYLNHSTLGKGLVATASAAPAQKLKIEAADVGIPTVISKTPVDSSNTAQHANVDFVGGNMKHERPELVDVASKDIDRKIVTDSASRYYEQSSNRLSESNRNGSPSHRDRKRRLSPNSPSYPRQRSPNYADSHSSKPLAAPSSRGPLADRLGRKQLESVVVKRRGDSPSYGHSRHRSPGWRSRSRSRSRSPRSRYLAYRSSRSPSPIRSRSRSGSPSLKKMKSADDGQPTVIPMVNPYSIVECEAPNLPSKPTNRCRDYDERGFCIRGDLCPFDHGTDPVVLDDVGLPPVLRFPGPGPMMPPHMHAVPRIDIHQPPPPLSMQYHPSAPYMHPGMSLPPGVIHPQRRLAPPPHAVVEPYMPQPFSPKTTLIRQQIAMSAPPPGYSVAGVRTYPNGSFDIPVTSTGTKWAGPTASRQADQRPPYFAQPPSRRQNNNLVVVPTQETIRSTVDRVVKLVEPLDAATEQLDASNVVTLPETAAEPHVTKSKFDYSRLSGGKPGTSWPNREKQGASVTLELRRVPPDLNTIAKINEHFTRFGTLVNLQVGYDGDPESALVSFASHAQAMAAYRCSEPLFNNRFIKIFWHNPDKSAATTGTKPTPAAQASLPEETRSFPPAHQLQMNKIRGAAVQNSVSLKREVSSEPSASVAKKPVKSVEARPVLSATSMSAPASFPSTRLNKNPPAVQSVKLTAKDRLNKEALRKRLELQKQSQQLIEKQIAQQKILFKKLESKKLSAEEKASIIKTIKTLDSSINMLKTDFVTKLPLAPAKTNETATSKVFASSAVSKPVLLRPTKLVRNRSLSNSTSSSSEQLAVPSVSVEVLSKTVTVDEEKPLEPKVEAVEAPSAENAEEMSVLRKQIAEMKREAVSLGLFDRPPTKSPLLMRRGMFGDKTVDRRPRQILVTGFIAEDKEDVLTHLLKFGDVDNSVIDTLVPSISITYKKRTNADDAVAKGGEYKGQKLNMSWHSADGKLIPASPTVISVRPQLSPVDKRSVNCSISSSYDDLETSTSLIGSHLGLLEDDIVDDEDVEDVLVAEEDEDECEGTRSWRR